MKRKTSRQYRFAPRDPLTRRETEVARLVSLGCSVDEVARILQVAAPTVDNTKAHVMTKLGVTKAATLTRAVIKAKISSLSDELTAAEKRRMRRGLK